ncbi:MAG TPA: SatD family protein [Anaerolineaceae bacterium]|nr:SatD family protein [Anaerolineaceae bacterium]
MAVKRKTYFAIIGDLIDSRKIVDRPSFQQEYAGLLSELNEKYASVIVSRFAITLGDEFQGVLGNAEKIMEILNTISVRLHPQKIRFGVGVGEMTTDPELDRNIGMDGPAFWRARSAIEYIHDDNDYGVSRTYVLAGDDANTGLINSSLAANDFIFSRMTTAQMQTFQELVKMGAAWSDFEQKQIAERLKIAASSVLRRLKSSGLKIYLRNSKEISSAIQSLGVHDENY